MIITGTLVAPGDKVLDSIGNYRMGNGLYEANRRIFASVAGYVKVYGHKDKSDNLVQVIEVRRSEDQLENELLPYDGAVVTAKVMAVGLRYRHFFILYLRDHSRFAKCDIISIGDRVYKKRFSALLPKKKLRPLEPELSEPFKNFVRPNDYILAKVCDDAGIKDKFVLSIAEDELGVVLCRGKFGETMKKVDWNTVVSTRTGKTEPRKMARVPQKCMLPSDLKDSTS
ncbi:CBN-EXOS-1 protein [Caenorhabditis brenneri]|uniref:CBN-EXOS-1 protein n=1 Tax=Caenorhabditis brenneri TaxID=135651 RepID=G0ML82_CAEBE|nr:CBN-EXOS-1 protein [Caenorhabditis brenneri]